jgi:hypothetical protein
MHAVKFVRRVSVFRSVVFDVSWSAQRPSKTLPFCLVSFAALPRTPLLVPSVVCALRRQGQHRLHRYAVSALCAFLV